VNTPPRKEKSEKMESFRGDHRKYLSEAQEGSRILGSLKRRPLVREPGKIVLAKQPMEKKKNNSTRKVAKHLEWNERGNNSS